MWTNLQNVFLKAVLAVSLAFAFICAVKKPLKTVPGSMGTVFRAVRETLAYGLFQLLLNMVYIIFYVLYIKNGTAVRFSDLGAAFTLVSVLCFYFLWRHGALSLTAYTLLPAAVYCCFLIYRIRLAKGKLGFFSYVIFNPMFGFIGNGAKGGTVAVISALLPVACAALGRGLALKRIDKKRKMCNNAK